MVEMTEKFTPKLERLLPGGSSQGGFLERGQTLEMVRDRDNRALEMLGYTHQEVADLLAPICEHDPFDRVYEYKAINGKEYSIYTNSYRGSQECPWEDPTDWKRSSGAVDYSIKAKDGSTTNIPGLLRHLIEEHRFFEGGPYRVSPEKIVELFGVEKIPGSIENAKSILI